MQQYVGYYVQFDKHTLHLEKTAAKMRGSAGKLNGIVRLLGCRVHFLHVKQVHVSKVRSVATYGAEIWGTSTTTSEFNFLDATEMPLLRRLLQCGRRPKHEFVLWWLKLQRLSAIALLQAIDLF